MKVALINTADAGGGAAEACMRLLNALREQQVDTTLVVQHKKRDNDAVYSVEKNVFYKFRSNFDFFYERLPFIAFRERDRTVRFAFSTANAGTDISTEQVIQDADVLHIHWTNSGFLSINDLKKLIRLDKPIIWTLHDMWLFTGGCHYAGTCDHFKRECGNCYFLRHPYSNDISHQGWQRKNRMLVNADNIHVVTCSTWMGEVARQSSLLSDKPIQAIPNPIDTDLFSPRDKAAARTKRGIGTDKKIILFGAANIGDRRKGLIYLVEALQLLAQQMHDRTNIEIVIFGKNKRFDTATLPYKVHALSIITSPEEIAEVYSLADVFVLPSVEDNLPNTIMEAMACGTPVVAFNTGGIPDMIDHGVNGYLAEYRSAADLANGIADVLASAGSLNAAAREKVLHDYNNAKVAGHYISLYREALERNKA